MATDRLGDMRLFAEAAASGSLSAAGRKLGLSPAAASARLFKLEAALHSKLFERTTRRLRLTEEGRIYLQHCTLALQAIADGEAALQASQSGVCGKLRLSASADFGRNLLNQWVEEFCAEHPRLQIAVTLSDSLSNLLQDDLDIAIRFGAPREETLIARRLADSRRVLCASPAYLAQHGVPRTPADLNGHRFIVLVTAAGPLNTFYFSQDGQAWSHTVPLESAWETNDGALARQWALAGHGIARKTIWDAADDIRTGRLKVILPDFTPHDAEIYAVFRRSPYQPPRVRLLLDFLIARFAAAGQSPPFYVAPQEE